MPAHSINVSELAKIPFLDADNFHGRSIPCLSFYHDHEWHLWIPTPAGALRKMKGEPAESDYFAESPERETDMYFDFLSFIAKRACWPRLASPINAITDDVLNLGASLAKLSLFHQASKDRELNLSRFVSTEIEYIFGVCRSLFDLLQEVISDLWETVTLHDKAAPKKKLHRAFTPMVMKKNQLWSKEEISSHHAIPDVLAHFYHQSAPFYQMLKTFRDDITHHGKHVDYVFVTERGFAVPRGTQPFASFGVWDEEHLLPNDLASLRPAIAYVITETLATCERFSQVIQTTIQFPPDIAPGFDLFVRGYHNEELLRMKAILEHCQWWDS